MPRASARTLLLLAWSALLLACTDDGPLGPLSDDRPSAPFPSVSAPDGDDDGIPDAVEPTVGTNPSVKDNDVFASARLFVMQLYRDVLGREGDAGGVAEWTAAIEQGGATRAQLADAFLASAEFQVVTAPVVRLYFAYFLRVPDTGGLLFWLDAYRRGVPLDDISQAFASSSEFQVTYGSLSNDEFVDLVFQNVLGRPPDPGGRAFWVSQLDAGLSRGSLMRGFSESDEFRTQSHADVYVTLAYVGMLRRSPDPGGFNFWTAQLESGAGGLALLQGILDALEYRDRFLPRGFSGSVRDLFGGGVAGLQVRVGTATAVTTGAGVFVTSLPPSGIQPVTVSGPGYFTRTTFARTSTDLPGALTVVPASFDMPAYDQIVRRGNGGTIRWTTTPQIYVDTRPDSVAGRVLPQSWITSTVAAANAFPSRWTDGRQSPTVTVGTTPPANFTTNTIVIRFTDSVNPSGCGGTVGQAAFSWNGAGELRSSVIRLALGRLCSNSAALIEAVVGHEVGHAYGLAHSTLSGRSSLMEPVIRFTGLTELDRRNAALHYRRAPGHAAPDVETDFFAQRGIAPQSLGPEKRETFVCGEP